MLQCEKCQEPAISMGPIHVSFYFFFYLWNVISLITYQQMPELNNNKKVLELLVLKLVWRKKSRIKNELNFVGSDTVDSLWMWDLKRFASILFASSSHIAHIFGVFFLNSFGRSMYIALNSMWNRSMCKFIWTTVSKLNVAHTKSHHTIHCMRSKTWNCP